MNIIFDSGFRSQQARFPLGCFCVLRFSIHLCSDWPSCNMTPPEYVYATFTRGNDVVYQLLTQGYPWMRSAESYSIVYSRFGNGDYIRPTLRWWLSGLIVMFHA